MFTRFRRKRFNGVLRDLLQETHLRVDDFIYPLFIKSGEGIKREIESMPSVYQMSIDEVIKECDILKALGIRSIILFGIPDTKDSVGSDALWNTGIIATALKSDKRAPPRRLGNRFKGFWGNIPGPTGHLVEYLKSPN